MREISPAVGMSVNEWLAHAPELKPLVEAIRSEKDAGKRLMPSQALIDKSAALDARGRSALLDKVAALVDENYCGRSEMCMQFALLLTKALVRLGLSAKMAIGTAVYFDGSGKRLFSWEHAWVRVGREVIDGNVDCLNENPVVPNLVQLAPYWGSIKDTPRDRQLRENLGAHTFTDEDVDNHWWPDLQQWLETEFRSLSNNQ